MAWRLSFGGPIGDRLSILSALVLAGLLGQSVLRASPADSPDRIIFLQVGQGDCTVIQSGGTTVLVDSAARNDVLDAGESLAVPQLYDLGVRHIDAIILTHPDSDHVGGLISVSRHFAVGKVFVNEAFRQHPDMLRTLALSRISSDRVLWVSSQRTLTFNRASLRIVAPPGEQPDNDNDGSLLTWVTMGKSSALLMGDASANVEYDLVARGLVGPVDLLKLGHHGSGGSTSAEFLMRTQPKWGLVSCGRNNTYGHPNAGVLERLRAVHCRVWRTDRQGEVEFRPTAAGFALAP